jgi:hypothetical protein
VFVAVIDSPGSVPVAEAAVSAAVPVFEFALLFHLPVPGFVQPAFGELIPAHSQKK